MEDEFKNKVIKWVKKVLKNEHFETIDVTFPNYDLGGGFGSEMTFVEVSGEKSGHTKILNLIVKKSIESLLQFDNINFNDVYLNELNIYSKVVPYFQKFLEKKKLKPFPNIPHCYGTIIEPNEYVIILENLKPKGFKLNDIRNPLDLSHSKLALEAYAKWHALSFALREEEPTVFEELGKCNKTMLETKVFDIFNGTIQNELDFVINIYEEKNKTIMIEKLKLLKKNYVDLATEILSNKNEDYLVIKHGDTWNNNLLFHYEDGQGNPDEVVIVDWQISSLGSPVCDVACYIFYGSSSQELEHLGELLDCYYDTLSIELRALGNEPEKCFPKKYFLESFRKYAPVGIAGMPMLAKMSNKKTHNYNATVDPNEKDFSKLLDGEMRDPEEYFNRINGILEYCIEHGFL
ncbi:hypothetical protein HHI36_002467 [Cryptolaemus montrouzieri]|uniref:CHK kinase-like domain-containing protein n=1 Tax=Cryptolaemus montrouzieri TaxID=559131 RepID=A0ABD2PAW3_9CUCU